MQGERGVRVGAVQAGSMAGSFSERCGPMEAPTSSQSAQGSAHVCGTMPRRYLPPAGAMHAPTWKWSPSSGGIISSGPKPLGCRHRLKPPLRHGTGSGGEWAGRHGAGSRCSSRLPLGGQAGCVHFFGRGFKLAMACYLGAGWVEHAGGLAAPCCRRCSAPLDRRAALAAAGARCYQLLPVAT